MASNADLRKRFGITRTQYDQLLEFQRGRCAICRKFETKTKPKTGGLSDLSVDHHHKSRRIRGLLCNRCNRGLGYFQDSYKILIAAARYVFQTRLVSSERFKFLRQLFPDKLNGEYSKKKC